MFDFNHIKKLKIFIFVQFSKWSEIKISDLPVKPYSMASIHQGFQRKFYGSYNQ